MFNSIIRHFLWLYLNSTGHSEWDSVVQEAGPDFQTEQEGDIRPPLAVLL